MVKTMLQLRMERELRNPSGANKTIKDAAGRTATDIFQSFLANGTFVQPSQHK